MGGWVGGWGVGRSREGGRVGGGGGVGRSMEEGGRGM